MIYMSSSSSKVWRELFGLAIFYCLWCSGVVGKTRTWSLEGLSDTILGNGIVRPFGFNVENPTK